MADIDVQRKGPSIWPWIVGLIVLALLIWALVEMFDDEADVAGVVDPPVAAPVVTPDPAAPADAGLPAAVSTYLTQCTEEQGAAEQDMGLEHQFTVNCLQRLREGLNALITQEQVADTDVSQRLETYTSTVQQLQGSEPTATNHANLTRDAAGTAVQLIQAMQTAWFGDDAGIRSAVGEVQQAAQGIQGTVPMLEQRESVRTFFREAGDALRMMAENRSTAAPA